MSAICPGCGGVLGRDCWNPVDCEWITRDMEQRAQQPQQQDPRCEGCCRITEQDVQCLGICSDLRSDADVDARHAVWESLRTTFAAADAGEGSGRGGAG